MSGAEVDPDQRDSGADALRAAASHAWPEADWASARHQHGAFHDVLIATDGPVIRAPIGTRTAVRAQQETTTLRAFENVPLSLPVPRALMDSLEIDGIDLVVTSMVSGEPVEDLQTLNPARLSTYADLLDSLHDLPAAAVPGIGAPRAWCGGSRWPDIVEAELLPRLEADVRESARRAVSSMLEAEDGIEPTVCHGDLGPHNILWEDDGPSALIDLDHACLGDPAIDRAPLVSFHGASAIRSLSTTSELQRALLHRATLPLQVAAAAHLDGLDSLRDHALANLTQRSRRGTLHDPGGMVPSDLPG